MKKPNKTMLPVVLLVMVLSILAVSQSVEAMETVELLENTDRCTYKDGIDHCFSKYLLCDNESVPKQSDISFIFQDTKRKYFTKNELGDKLDYEVEIEKKDDCFEISITGWKNPYIDMDNILCSAERCYGEYAWWHSSYAYKMPIYGYCPHCSSSTEMTLLASNSTHNIGAYISGSLELFWGNFTVNSTWKIIGYVYYNNETDYVLVDTTETYQLEMFIDEGNSTDYGTPEKDLIAWYTLGEDCNATHCPDKSLYDSMGIKTASGAPTDIAGKIGGGQDFTGVRNQGIYVPDDDTLDIEADNENLTYAMWIKPDTKIEAYSSFFHKHLNYVMILQADLSLNTQLWNSTTAITMKTAASVVSYGNWYFVAYTWDNSTNTVKIYLDGISMPLTDSSYTESAGYTGDLHIGYYDPGTTALNGIIDNVMMWNRTLSDGEIMMEYNNTVGTHNVTEFSAEETLVSGEFYNITLTSPDNLTSTADDTPDFTFTPHCTYADVSCELFLNGSGYGVNSSVPANTSATITANASLGDDTWTWYVECTNSTDVEKSEYRYITILSINAVPIIRMITPEWWEFWKQSEMKIDYMINYGGAVWDTLLCSDCDDRFVNTIGDAMTGDLIVSGNIIAANVFLPSFIFAHTNTSMDVDSAGMWYNVSFDEEAADPKLRIVHTHNDSTNNTFTIQDDGYYDIHYMMSFQDAAPAPSSHIVMRTVLNGVEIKGSLLEEDSHKQYSDFTIYNGPIIYLTAGDEIKFQFTSDSTDVSLTSHRTYGEHHDVAVIKIKRIA